MPSSDEVYTVFDFCLPDWASCAAAKADEQVARVLAMEEEKHQPKNLLETDDGGEIVGKSLHSLHETIKPANFLAKKITNQNTIFAHFHKSFSFFTKLSNKNIQSLKFLQMFEPNYM